MSKEQIQAPKKAPFIHKAIGLATTVALAACSAGERIGIVYPTPEGTKTNPTETVPSLFLTFDEAVSWSSQPGEKGFVHFNSEALQVPGGMPGHLRWSIGDCSEKDCGSIDGYIKVTDNDGNVWYEPDKKFDKK